MMGSGLFDFATLPPLTTRRLLMRPIVPDDLRDWLNVMAHPAVHEYLIDFETAPDEAEMRSIITWTEEIFAQKRGIRWAITLFPCDRLIGSCGFHLYDPAHRRVEIGYELHRDYWRRGIMSEAVDMLMTFCFERLNVHRMEADVTVGNLASASLLQGLGFQFEGTWRERVFKRGQFQSLWQFAMLAPAYHRRSETA